MTNKIEVVDLGGKALKSTYDKRAKQLVKSGRARWIDMDKIMLLPIEADKEVFDLPESGYEYVGNNNSPSPHHDSYRSMGYVPVPDETYDFGFTDEELFKLAKKRVNERKGFLIHAVSYILVNVFIFFVSLAEGEPIVFFTAGGWGIGLGIHAVSYFVSSGPEAIQREYQKLKRGDLRRSLRG